MKKIFIITAIMISAIACSKDNNSQTSSSIIGNWSFAGIYTNGVLKVISIPVGSPIGLNFKSDMSYTIINTKGDTSDYGNYSSQKPTVPIALIPSYTTDSLVCISKDILPSEYLPPTLFYYTIKQDSLFMISVASALMPRPEGPLSLNLYLKNK